MSGQSENIKREKTRNVDRGFDSYEFGLYPKGNENPFKCSEEGEWRDQSYLLGSDSDCGVDSAVDWGGLQFEVTLGGS